MYIKSPSTHNDNAAIAPSGGATVAKHRQASYSNRELAGRSLLCISEWSCWSFINSIYTKKLCHLAFCHLWLTACFVTDSYLEISCCVCCKWIQLALSLLLLSISCC